MKYKSDSASVILVSMPFVPIAGPSPALSALAASLRIKGIDVRCLYPGFHFAEIIGLRNYLSILNFSGHGLLGEWIFSHVAFPEFVPDDEAYLLYLSEILPHLSSDYLLSIRKKATAYIDEIARDIVNKNPRIVGCSSVFYQNCASLALLRRIRELSPGIVTVMGGANCEGEMGVELHKRYQWVDFVFSGEADFIFPEFCHRILNNEPIVSQGYKLSNSIRTPEDRLSPEAPLTNERIYDLTLLPYADYDDYFVALKDSPLRNNIFPVLKMETSRGCWWGEVSPCSFCGASGDTHKYRVKDAQSAYDEITSAARKHDVSVIVFTDNCLYKGYFKTLLPMLSKENLLIFYEVKPNITHEQCKILSEAGVRVVQAGIESLHDGSLKLLNKGITVFHSVRFLKWAYKHGIFVVWNYLWDIPGEELSWYDEVCELIPLLTHLQPPMTSGFSVRIDRFSRYHNNPQAFGIQLEASPAYSFIYPPGSANDCDDNKRIAYQFVDVSPNKTQHSSSPEVVRLTKLLKEWINFFKESKRRSLESALCYSKNEQGILVIKDARSVAVISEHKLKGLEAEIYEMCDDGATYVQLSKAFCDTASGVSEHHLSEILSRLIENKLMVKLSGFYLSLAISLPFRNFVSLEGHAISM